MPIGKVTMFDLSKGYGFIATRNFDVYVWYKDVEGYGQYLQKGDVVEFDIANGPKGLKAVNVVIKSCSSKDGYVKPQSHSDKPTKALNQGREKSNSNILQNSSPPQDIVKSGPPSITKVARDFKHYLAQALLAKEGKDFIKARELFELAITHGGDLQVFYSYAAMEKNLGQFESARRVFQRGIEKFPSKGKLYEDYGNLEKLTNNLEQAAQIFRQGVKAAPDHKYLHRYLAETLLKLGSPEQLAEAEKHYEKSIELHVATNTNVQEYALVKVLRGPTRGKMTNQFLNEAGFLLHQVIQRPVSSNAVDFIVKPMRPEYIESYDLSDEIFIRCLYKNNPTIQDVDLLIKNFQEDKEASHVNRDVLFLSLQNTANVRNYLYKLIESVGKNPTIVPIEDMQLQAGLNNSDCEAVLKQILDEWLYRRNLYDVRFPVSGRKFFGRENELLGLIRNIESGNPVGLFGLRKVGKTSLLKRLKEKRSQDIIIDIDLQAVPPGVEDCSYLYWDMAQQLGREVENKFPDIAKNLKFSLAGRFRSYVEITNLQNIALRFDADFRMVKDALSHSPETSKVKAIVLLDELEIMLPTSNNKGFKGYTTFFAYLRGMSQQDGFLISIVTGANSAICEEPQWEGRDNPVFKFYQEIFLPPLERYECDEMIKKLGRGMGINYTPSGLDQIYKETGGHPFITRQLCSRIVKNFQERPLTVDKEKVQVGVHEFLFHDAATFREILSRLERDFPVEKDLLLFIADEVNTESLLSDLCKSNPQEGLKHLIGYQLVERRGNLYQYKMALLQKWVRQNWLDKEDEFANNT